MDQAANNSVGWAKRSEPNIQPPYNDNLGTLRFAQPTFSFLIESEKRVPVQGSRLKA